MATMRDAFALASGDEAAQARLWSDPAAFGKEAGLRGSALAELVGSVRGATRHREDGIAAMTLFRGAINVENGWGTWPFADAPVTEWPSFVEVTEHHTTAIVSASFYGVTQSDVTLQHRTTWAKALREEAIERAADLDEIPVEVADALVAANALLDACEKIRTET